MAGLIDITGQTFGLLTAVKVTERRNGSTYWLVTCKCGNQKEVTGSDLRAGKQKSCGSSCTNRNKFFGFREPEEQYLYVTWRNMMRRCHNKDDSAYHNYGGRGIHVCKKWHKYESFKKDVLSLLGERPDNHDFDRRDNNLGYNPNNVRWVTRRKNVANTRKSMKLRVKGKLVSFSDLFNRKPRICSYTVARARYFKLGWKLKIALTTPDNHRWPKGYTKHLRGV